MEPVTHMLCGAVISRAGFNRKTALATATLVIASELPDMDVLWAALGPAEGFAHHRGFTHTLLGAPVMAALAVGIIYGWQKWGKRTMRADSARTNHPQVRWPWLYVCALVGSLTHILLDFTNNYGVRPFFPFQDRWYAWDIVFIFEPLIFLALLAALVAPWFGGLIAGEIASRRQTMPGRAGASAALVFIVALWWFRDYQHRHALAMMSSVSYSGEEAVKLGVNPRMLDPFSWSGVVETPHFFRVLDVNTRLGDLDPQQTARTYPKPEETTYSLAAKQSRYGRAFLDWARFPYTEVELLPAQQGGGAIVRMRDLRFAYLERNGNPLAIWVELDKDANVLRQGSGRRSEGP